MERTPPKQQSRRRLHPTNLRGPAGATTETLNTSTWTVDLGGGDSKVAVGETVILLTPHFHPYRNTCEMERECSRVTVSPTAAPRSVTHRAPPRTSISRMARESAPPPSPPARAAAAAAARTSGGKLRSAVRGRDPATLRCARHTQAGVALDSREERSEQPLARLSFC